MRSLYAELNSTANASQDGMQMRRATLPVVHAYTQQPSLIFALFCFLPLFVYLDE
jgi:hypothetical protein